MKAILAVLFVFVGCCTNMIFLETLVKEDPACGNLINFCQFVVISVEGFLITLRCGTKKPVIPMRDYVMLVLYFFVVSTANNISFNFKISVTLYLIFRSGSLMANLVLGMILLGKRYSTLKYISVVMISVGIAICTVASGKGFNSNSNPEKTEDFSDYFWWLIGIAIMTLALFASARMGLYQEVLFKTYGKHPREALFFTHFLPLPGYLLLYRDIMAHIVIANSSTAVDILGYPMPIIWICIAGNVLTQCICVNCVYILATEYPSLTVTLVVTLRKFLSIFISIFYFNNVFTLYHWFGTLLVFAGTVMYTDIFSKEFERGKGILYSDK